MELFASGHVGRGLAGASWRRLAVVACLAVFPALGSPPASSTPQASSPSQASADGVWTIRLIQTGQGRCRVVAVHETRKSWELDRCVGTPDDLLFIANSGQRFWVLRVLPRIPRRYRERPLKWGGVEVAALYDRRGHKLRRRRLASFVGPHHRDGLRKVAGRFTWIAGVAEVPGRPPRITQRDRVELDTAAGKTYRLGF